MGRASADSSVDIDSGDADRHDDCTRTDHVVEILQLNRYCIISRSSTTHLPVDASEDWTLGKDLREGGPWQ